MKFRKIGILAMLASISLAACGGSSKKKETVKYVDSITVKAAEGTKTETGYDMVLELTDTGSFTYSYTPSDVVASFTLKSSNTSVATVGEISTGGRVTPLGEGETEIYVTTLGKDDALIESNHLKVKVNAPQGKTNKDFEKARLTYMDGDVEKPLYMQTIYTNSNAPHLDSLSEAHVLVVPFGFTDSSLVDEVQTQETLDRIHTTFFGTKEEVEEAGGWYSMSEFYKTSSYGLSQFEGDVLPTWCVYNGTSSAFYNKYKSSLGIGAAEYARTWYMSEYAKTGHGQLGEDAKPFTYYDCNQDGFLDLVWIVYSHPTGDTSNWWAYVTYTGNVADLNKPTVKTLGFASVDWMNSAFNGYDPHTFIHETGHTYGLDDYYDYNNLWKPMGSIDFMDQNLGDHCMFSKFTLGWTAPWVVDDDATITLRPGTTTGDCFILPSPDYNGTAFDEYIMVELMAPVGLAEYDYKNGYGSTAGYSEPGLRITHVDARVHKGNHDTYCIDDPEHGIDFRVCNTKGGRISVKSDSDYMLLDDGSKSYFCLTGLFESVINPNNNCMTSANYNASNASLFKRGKFNLMPGVKDGWAEVFMPSKTNLWNKAKTTTGWSGMELRQEIDPNCTFNYAISNISIKADSEYGYIATMKVTADAY